MIDQELLRWKADRRRKPLLLKGARQVGKSWSVGELGRTFEETVTLDLERDRSLHRVFEGDLDANRLVREMRILKSASLVPGKSLLFVDEVQACPRAIMALRYLYEQLPELHVAAAGSLLEFALADISFPVGRVRFLEMHPMTFAEFLWAVGKDAAAEVVLGPPGEVPQAVHEMLLEQLRIYFFVGGMPESVGAWESTGSMVECGRVQDDLAESYRRDFGKYAPRSDPRCLDAVFESVALQVGNQIKYTRLTEDFSGVTAKKAFDLLTGAQVVNRVPAAGPAGLPLGATASAKRFKALMVDIGLMQKLRALPPAREYRKGDLLGIHQGAMAEQFVGQEMMVSQGRLFYWSRGARGSTAEVDYLASVDGKVVPVEVKSGPAGRLRSLHMLLEKYPEIPHGIVLSSRPYAKLTGQRIRFVPIYQALSATTGKRE